MASDYVKNALKGLRVRYIQLSDQIIKTRRGKCVKDLHNCRKVHGKIQIANTAAWEIPK